MKQPCENIPIFCRKVEDDQEEVLNRSILGVGEFPFKLKLFCQRKYVYGAGNAKVNDSR